MSVRNPVKKPGELWVEIGKTDILATLEVGLREFVCLDRQFRAQFALVVILATAGAARSRQ